MATITAKRNGKPTKTLRNVPERDVDWECAALEDEGYTRISVTDGHILPHATGTQRRKADRAKLSSMYRTDSIESMLG